MRPLGIPSVKDRIAQQAVKMVIEPIFEKEFLDMNYGFRPKRGAHMALEEVTFLIKEGFKGGGLFGCVQIFDQTSIHSRIFSLFKRALLILRRLIIKQSRDCNFTA